MNLEQLRKIERLYIHSRQQHYVISEGLRQGFFWKSEAFVVWKTYRIAAENMARLCKLGIFKLDRENSDLYVCLVKDQSKQVVLKEVKGSYGRFG